MLSFLLKNPITTLTAILVFITAYYAWQTRMMVKEMEIARQHQIIPSLRINPTRLYLGDSFDIEITNIGLGPAKNIRGKIRLWPEGEEIEVVYPTLYPQEKFALHSPFKSVKSFQDVGKFKKLILKASFEDITNKRYEFTDKFNIEDLVKIRNDDHSSDEISNELRRIERKLDDIKSAIEHLRR